MIVVDIEILFHLQAKCLLCLWASGLNRRLTPKKKRKQLRERVKCMWVNVGCKTWSVTWRERVL